MNGVRAICGLVLLAALSACSKAGHDEVVVYVSEDQVFSEPILKDFERDTGIRVRAVYDTEEAKSTGVMNRLMAERANPQADVYWANEPIRAEVLRQEGMTEAYVSPESVGIPAGFRDGQGHWTGFSARARVLLVGNDVQEQPSSVTDLAAPRFRGRVAMASPLFGTTTAGVAALFTLKGDAWGDRFLADLRQNQIKVTTSNGDSADAVASGAAALSRVDSDDAVSRIRQLRPVRMIVPDQDAEQMGVMLIPNTVLVLRGARHPTAARQLVDYLVSPDTELKLARADCAQIPLHSGVAPPRELPSIELLKAMPVDYGRVAAKLRELQPRLQAWVAE